VIGFVESGFGRNIDTIFHPDLQPNIHPLTRVDFSNYVYGNSCYYGACYHGTAVAGVYGASMLAETPAALYKSQDSVIPLGIGIVGVAPTSQMVLLCYMDGGFNQWGSSVLSNMVQDIQYLIDSCDVDIANFSWGVMPEYPPLEAVLEILYFDRRTALFASAGNCGIDYPTCPYESLPASLSYVFSVGACDSLAHASSISNWYKVDFVTPGEQIFTAGGSESDYSRDLFDEDDTLDTMDGYSSVSGTSLSSPMAAGVASLMLSVAPDIHPATIYDVLVETCHDIGDPGRDSLTGWGIVNAKSAVAKVSNGLYCNSIPGDVNADCYVNGGDVDYLADYLYCGGPQPPIPNNADVDGNCTIDVVDVTYLVAYVNQGGPPPLPGCVEPDGANGQHSSGDPMPAAVLDQNYPNPFNPTTEIAFTLPTAGHVTLEIYNILGQRVAILVDGFRKVGQHTVTWDASGQSSGIYFYRLQAGELVETKKTMLLK